MGKDQKSEKIKQLNDAIAQLLDSIRELEDQLNRERFENQTLRSQIKDLKADLARERRKLDAARRS